MKITEKLYDLGFVIGAFFTLVSIVMIANNVIRHLKDHLSWYTSLTFLLFGLLMMFARKKKSV